MIFVTTCALSRWSRPREPDLCTCSAPTFSCQEVIERGVERADAGPVTLEDLLGKWLLEQMPLTRARAGRGQGPPNKAADLPLCPTVNPAVRHSWAVEIDPRTLALATLTVVTSVVLGFLAGAWAGVWTGLAGLIPATLWEITRERRENAALKVKRRAAASTAFPVTVSTADASDVADTNSLSEHGAAWYLRPEAEVVAFWPRSELVELRKWCSAEGHMRVRLVTGEGGTGKTRLGVQLSRDLVHDGWRSMWVAREQELAAVAAVRAIGEPAVLIVDYAETRPDLAAMLAEAASADDAPDMRVVLLARSTGEWWQQVVNSADYLLGRVLEAAEPITLGPVTTLGTQHELFAEALSAFAARLGIACPDASFTLIEPEPVILVVHAAALLSILDQADVEGVPGRPRTTEEILVGLLGHEARYWHKTAVARGLIIDPSLQRLAVTAGCLIGADDEADATALLARVPDLADSAERRGQIARWLHDLYPGTWASDSAAAVDWIGPLSPDRVAEELITAELSTRPSLLTHLVAGLNRHRMRRTLTILARAALTDTRAVGMLRCALEADLEHLAVPSLTVAVETNSAIGDLIDEALTARPVSGAILEDIAAALPHPAFTLAKTAVDVFQRLVESASDGGQRARRLVDLSVRLAGAGRREEALAAIEEATGIYRQLNEAQPDAYQPQLAISLNNQSLRLSGLSLRKEALAALEEATEIYRQLTKVNPEAFQVQLASSLNNQSSRLSDLGRKEEALEAIEEAAEIYRQLAQIRPKMFQHDLATALRNKALRLAGMGRREEALITNDEATGIYRQLAQTRPEAFEPDLATALNSQAIFLASLARREEALTAIKEALTLQHRFRTTRRFLV
jgi:Tetratricopeptide repeat